MPEVGRKQRRIDLGRTSLYFELPLELREGLRELALAEDRSMGYVLRRAIRMEIARNATVRSNTGAA